LKLLSVARFRSLIGVGSGLPLRPIRDRPRFLLLHVIGEGESDDPTGQFAFYALHREGRAEKAGRFPGVVSLERLDELVRGIHINDRTPTVHFHTELGSDLLTQCGVKELFQVLFSLVRWLRLVLGIILVGRGKFCFSLAICSKVNAVDGDRDVRLSAICEPDCPGGVEQERLGQIEYVLARLHLRCLLGLDDIANLVPVLELPAERRFGLDRPDFPSK
jgi:hypothetical protein